MPAETDSALSALPLTKTSLPKIDVSLGAGEMRNLGEVRQWVGRRWVETVTVECRAKLQRKTGFNIIIANGLKMSDRHWEIFSDLCLHTKACGSLIPDAWFAALANKQVASPKAKNRRKPMLSSPSAPPKRCATNSRS